MRRAILIVVVIAVAGFAAFMVFQKINRITLDKDFVLNEVNGKPFTLSHYAGQPIILSFMLARCSECKTEATFLNRIYNKYKSDKKLMVVGVGEDKEVEDFVKNLEIIFPVVMDEKHEVAHLYNAKKVPHLVFIDKQGKIINEVVEKVLDEAALEEILKGML